jgi:DNA-binding IclR family transcriptional regulator
MLSTSRPKYLQDRDDVQDCIEETPGLTLKEIADKTGLSYAAVQQAALILHHRKFIRRERKRALVFYPNP